MDDRVLMEMAGELKMVVDDENIDPYEIPAEMISTLDLYRKRGGTANFSNASFQRALVDKVIRMGDA